MLAMVKCMSVVSVGVVDVEQLALWLRSIVKRAMNDSDLCGRKVICLKGLTIAKVYTGYNLTAIDSRKLDASYYAVRIRT